MRRYSLGLIVLVATILAMPASGRGFRTDSQPCSDALADICWDFDPTGTSFATLPINQSSFTLDQSGITFSTSNFSMIMFDYQQFLTDKGISGTPAFTVSYFQGLLRPNDDPLFRIDIQFDSSALGGWDNIKDVFAVFGNDDPQNPTSAGVQLLFGLEPADGFQLNGLIGTANDPGGYKYASNSAGWIGADQACDTFASDGTCIGLSTPEPSSVALLGLGFLALVVGLRTGRSAPARLA